VTTITGGPAGPPARRAGPL